jgi:hypothetical protein
MTTAEEESEELVSGVVEDARSKIAEKHEELVEDAAEQLSSFREMNVFFSEVRRKVEKQHE